MSYKYPSVNDERAEYMVVTRLIAGIALCLGGYRISRVAVPLLLFVAGGDILLKIVALYFDGSNFRLYTYDLAFFLCGALCAGIAWNVRAGFAASAAIAAAAAVELLFDVLVLDFYWYRVYTMLAVGLIWGVYAATQGRKWPKYVLVVATSFVGAGLFANGVQYYRVRYEIEDTYMTFGWYHDKPYVVEYITEVLTALMHKMLAVQFGAFVFGIGVQLLVTGRGTHHNAVLDKTSDASMTSSDAVATAELESGFVEVQTPLVVTAAPTSPRKPV